MPIYEYQCPKCGKVFEEWVHLSEAHLEVPCPDCGVGAPRIISETSFVLKGGGWYVTDYGYRKGVKEEGSSSASASDGGSDKADAPAKAEAKAETAARPAASPAPAAPAAPAKD